MASTKLKKRFFKISATLLLLMVVGGLVTCSVTNKNVNKLYLASKDKTYDVIIVPGYPFENGNWNDIMKIRVYWSKYLYDRGIAKNIIYSGSAVYSPYFEAEIMALYAIELGIPKEHIFTETKAEHSSENVYYSFKKAKNLGFNTIALATDPFQTKMIRSFMKKKLSKQVTMIPIVYDSLRAISPAMTDPKIDFNLAFDTHFVSITEREGFWKRFRGTLGQNINEGYYE